MKIKIIYRNPTFLGNMMPILDVPMENFNFRYDDVAPMPDLLKYIWDMSKFEPGLIPIQVKDVVFVQQRIDIETLWITMYEYTQRGWVAVYDSLQDS